MQCRLDVDTIETECDTMLTLLLTMSNCGQYPTWSYLAESETCSDTDWDIAPLLLQLSMVARRSGKYFNTPHCNVYFLSHSWSCQSFSDSGWRWFVQLVWLHTKLGFNRCSCLGDFEGSAPGFCRLVLSHGWCLALTWDAANETLQAEERSVRFNTEWCSD